MVAHALKRAGKQAFDRIFWIQSRRELRELLTRHPSGASEDILAVTARYKGAGWYKRLSPFQVPREFAALCDWSHALKPRVVVELGTAAGATLLLWSRTASKRVVSVDLEFGIHGGGYAAEKGRLYREFLYDRPDVTMDLIRGDSQDPAIRDDVRQRLAGEPVDVLFIDADHRIEGVTRDFELWRELVRPGGSIVFHDILPNVTLESCQVDQLWRRITSEYPGQTREIVHAHDQEWAGIGILTV